MTRAWPVAFVPDWRLVLASKPTIGLGSVLDVERLCEQTLDGLIEGWW